MYFFPKAVSNLPRGVLVRKPILMRYGSTTNSNIEESLGLWSEAKKDYMFVISLDSKNFSALYNLANVEGSTSHWDKARDLFSKAALYLSLIHI